MVTPSVLISDSRPISGENQNSSGTLLAFHSRIACLSSQPSNLSLGTMGSATLKLGISEFVCSVFRIYSFDIPLSEIVYIVPTELDGFKIAESKHSVGIISEAVTSFLKMSFFYFL